MAAAAIVLALLAAPNDQSTTAPVTAQSSLEVPVWCYSDQKLPDGPRFAEDDNVAYMSTIFNYTPASSEGVSNLEGGIITRAWHSKLERVETSPRVYERCVFYKHGETALAQQEQSEIRYKFERAAMDLKVLDWAYPETNEMVSAQPPAGQAPATPDQTSQVLCEWGDPSPTTYATVTWDIRPTDIPMPDAVTGTPLGERTRLVRSVANYYKLQPTQVRCLFFADEAKRLAFRKGWDAAGLHWAGTWDFVDEMNKTHFEDVATATRYWLANDPSAD